MNAKDYARMLETGLAPCGCPRIVSLNGQNESATVEHSEECEDRIARVEASRLANLATAAARAEKQEARQVLATFTAAELRSLKKLAGKAA